MGNWGERENGGKIRRENLEGNLACVRWGVYFGDCTLAAVRWKVYFGGHRFHMLRGTKDGVLHMLRETKADATFASLTNVTHKRHNGHRLRLRLMLRLGFMP